MISSSKLRPSLETAFQLLPPAAGRCNYQEERQRQRALDRAGRLGIASSRPRSWALTRGRPQRGAVADIDSEA